MQIRKNKSLTPAQRVQAANEQTATALFVFEQAAVSLEMAADEFMAIEADLYDQAQAKRIEAEALDGLSYAAFERGEQTREQAETIRGLLGITTGNA